MCWGLLGATMNNGSKYWSDLSTRDFEQCAIEDYLIVMPIGAMEQHGPHLPLSVDCLIVQEIVRLALNLLQKDTPVLVLPTQKVGLSTEHQSFKGTLTHSPELVIKTWMELGDCLARTGVKKLLLFNAHGGHQGLIDIVARELRAKHNILVYSSSWYQLPIEKGVEELFDPEEHRFGIHAGAIETSMVMAMHPELVNRAAFQNFGSTAKERSKKYPILGNSKSAKFGWMIEDYNESGAVGDLSQASAAKGQALLDNASLSLSRLILEILSLPLDTLKA
jgi:creatinine amidohydrolase